MAEAKGTLTPRPYARLITMIGDQLIRNEKIALIEIIKNSYDADATWIQIRFINFAQKDDELKFTKDSRIEIEDDGIGMTFDIIKDAWMNPASPHKYLQRKIGKNRTKRGRITQGEKGIGRFAVFKIGSTVEILTRSEKPGAQEIYLKSDLSIYDEELLTKKGAGADDSIFLDDIKYEYEIREKPKNIVEGEAIIQGTLRKRPSHGTIIRISNLRGIWTLDKTKDLFNDCLKLISPFNKPDFTVDIVLDGKTVFTSQEKNRLDDLLEIAPIKMEGNVADNGSLEFSLNGKKQSMSLKEMSEDGGIRSHFFDGKGKLKRLPECGPFEFKFYVFDLERRASLRSSLTTEDRELIKSHRIYLYRDGIRIYPYGDPTDDWIGLDIRRGIVKAGSYLSNDQVVGYIGVSIKDNPKLRDKTNREGLMDIGNAYDDLITIILGILGYLKKEFTKLKVTKELKEDRTKRKKGLFIEEPKVEKSISVLLDRFNKRKDNEGLKIVKKLVKTYREERKVFTERAEIVEDLAGVGMAVDAASHDLMIMMGRAAETLNLLVKISEADNLDKNKLVENVDKLRGQFAFIGDQLHGIQPLFRSSRRISRDWKIRDIIDKVKLYYTVPIQKNRIKICIDEVGPPLLVKCHEAVLLQSFINLIDNAVYWLTTSESEAKEIRILINGNKSEVIFADNGPGVRKDDLPYIFQPFFSTKGIKGRGLGLYIARQLLERYDYEIDYIENKAKTILDGANFLISFGKGDTNER
jgi:hypothetical protein